MDVHWHIHSCIVPWYHVCTQCVFQALLEFMNDIDTQRKLTISYVNAIDEYACRHVFCIFPCVYVIGQ